MSSTVRDTTESKEDVRVCSRQCINLQRQMRLFRYVVDSK